MFYFKNRPITYRRVVRAFDYRLEKVITSITGLVCSFVDPFVVKQNNYWIFPVYFIGRGDFCDHALAVFEKVKDDPQIKKIILTREAEVKIDGKNTVIVPMKSFRAIWYLLCSKIIFVQHSIWLDLSTAKYQMKKPLERNIINLWHGIPIKDISHGNTGIVNKRSLLEMPNYKVISSSKIDKANMQKAFFKTPKENFWITGLPRNDFLVMDERQLPESYRTEIKKLRNLLNGKKLILYAPTYRETNVNGTYYDFSDKDLDVLEAYLDKNNAVFGLRYHIYRKPACHQKILQRKNIIDLSAENISDVRLLIREAELVITDYSSLYVDALYINKKCISFAYDFEHYLKTQRGFFYDFESVFPGEICQSFEDMMETISKSDDPYSKEQIDKIKTIQTMLFKYLDANNSQRVVDRVRALS